MPAAAVTTFPRERMRNITSASFALVKTPAIFS
jgi:hypothetical protein